MDINKGIGSQESREIERLKSEIALWKIKANYWKGLFKGLLSFKLRQAFKSLK